MLRAIAAVVVGYFVMAALAVASAGVSWGILGAEGAFAEGSTVASTPWSVLSVVMGLIAAVLAGFIAAQIGRHPTNMPVKILAGFVLLFGLALAVVTSGATPTPIPEGKTMADMTFFEAGQVASNPAWYLWLIPVVGAVGTLIGGRLRKVEPAA